MNMTRLAITFRDSNSYAAMVSIFLFIILKLEKKTYMQVVTMAVCFELINLSGSRMGALLFAVIGLWWLSNRIKKQYYIPIGIIACLVFFMVNQMASSLDDESEATAITRIFDKESGQHANAESSSIQRQSSIRDGITFGLTDNLILPAGNFYFDYKWRNTSNHDYHFPHSSFIYLFCEYGIYCIFFFVLLFKFFLFARKKKCLMTFFITVFPLLLLPNIVYVFPLYLGACLIDFRLLEEPVGVERKIHLHHEEKNKAVLCN